MTPTRTTAALILLLTISARTQAQPLGQFQWQLEPFCNTVTVNVTQSGAIYTLDGFDNQCGGANPRAPLVGVAAFNPADGSIGFGLNIVTTPNGAPVHVRATIFLPQLSGTWSDSAGNGGTFAFGASGPGIGPRPAGLSVPTLTVAGSASFGGALSAGSLSATGNGTFGGALVAASVSSSGGGTFGGALSASSLSVTSNGTFGGTLTADTISADILTASDITAASNTGVGLLRANGVSNSGQPQVVLTRSLGVPGAPLPLSSNQSLGSIFFAGFDGSSTPNAALIGANAGENWTQTARGTRLSFSTVANGTTTLVQRMRITDAGLVGIGTTAPDQLLTVNGNASKVGGGSWATFSDERLKTVHGTFRRGLTDVLRLQPIRFEYTPDNPLGLRGAGEYVGFSAQAVREVIPEAVTESTSGYLQINADPILWTMVNALKDLKTENDALAGRNADLERRIAALEAAIRKP
jgi:hypothetical protein